MLVTNKDKSKNAAQIMKGKLKARLGRFTGNHDMELSGQNEAATGHLKQASEEVKDALNE